MHNSYLLLLALFGLTGTLSAQDPKPDVYNNVSTPSQYDKDVRKTYSEKYNIIDIKDPQNYQLPSKLGGEWPQWDKPGFATALFIVSKNGKIIEPTIVKESHPELGKSVLQALKTWKVTPPTLDGKMIDIVSAQEFFFGREEFVQLFMPSWEMQARVKDIHQLAQFIEAIQSACQQYFGGKDINASVVVAIKPERKVRYWIVSETKGDYTELMNELEKLAAPEVRNTVIFSVLSAVTGSKFDPSRPVLPEEWENAASQSNKPMQLDEVVDKVWKP